MGYGMGEVEWRGSAKKGGEGWEKLWQRNDRWSRNISGFCFREKIVRNCE